MKTTIDGAGRIVVPKSVRDQLHLTPGSELEIDVLDDSVVIRHRDVAEESCRVHDRSGRRHVEIEERTVD